ncbi:MAG: hypothetical protein KME59_00170 [Trichormus sp. ATA11-4-KO1]|jgi:hypothetical protein|nr:hypothetical protein [Trichormus sp. ATA11-4-KO1]
MTFERKVAGIFNMSETTWERHANPWSGWTRIITGLPFLILAFWSRIWLGWWALIPIAIVVLWIWLNPRIFPKPRSTNNWVSKSVLGERVWLNRDKISVPQHHRRVPNILSAISALGGVLVIWGLVTLNIWITLLGTTSHYSGKLWYLDRMVWLYEEMKETNADYRSWLY